jgi:hypothetical protein
VIKNIVAFHWALETHGKTSGMNQNTAARLIPKEFWIYKDVNRMFFLHAHFAFEDLGKIMEIVNKRAMKCVTAGTILALDEGTYGYQPSLKAMKKAEKAGEPMTKLHIPRKPHPNCFLSNLITTCLDGRNLPYVLVAMPFWHYPQDNPRKL